MDIFETIVIFNPKYDGSITLKEAIDKFNDIAQSFSTKKKVKLEEMGEKKLAYEIKGCTTGYYVVFTYAARPDDILELERQMRVEDKVIKFITVKTDKDEDCLKDYVDVAGNNKSEQDRPASKDVFDQIFGT